MTIIYYTEGTDAPFWYSQVDCKELHRLQQSLVEADFKKYNHNVLASLLQTRTYMNEGI